MNKVNPKQARENLGLTQTQMARAMGVVRGTWLKWERKEQGITAAPRRLIEIMLKHKKNGTFETYFGEYIE